MNSVRKSWHARQAPSNVTKTVQLDLNLNSTGLSFLLLIENPELWEQSVAPLALLYKGNTMCEW